MDANGRHNGGVVAPRPITRLRQAVLAAALCGCASSPGPAPAAASRSGLARGSDAAVACVVEDTSARTRDTLYVVGLDPKRADAAPSDCGRRVLAAGSSPVVVTLTPASGTDLRDVLDRGFPDSIGPRLDVIVTRDPGVLAYAAASADYFITSLPWNRTYVLVTGDSSSIIPSDAERDALARDAVTADARGAAQPFEWLADPSCVAPSALSSSIPRSVVAYVAGDPIARQLAERIVALAAGERPAWLPASLTHGAQAPRVAPVATDSIPDILAAGRAAAVVVALVRDPRAPCGTTNAPLPWRGIPLLDSRAHVIIRRGSGAAFTVGVDGSLWFIRRAVK